MHQFFYCILFCLCTICSYAQVNLIQNGSFEGEFPKCGTPKKWQEVKLRAHESPCILPGRFNVDYTPIHGESYLCMNTDFWVFCKNDGTRKEVESYSSTMQHLSQYRLKANHTYQFSAYCARSNSFRKIYPKYPEDPDTIFFTKPIVLEVVSCNSKGKEKELLSRIGPVEHSEWKLYQIKFTPTKEVEFIQLRCFYHTPTIKPYPGNILVDNVKLVPTDPQELNAVEQIEVLNNG